MNKNVKRQTLESSFSSPPLPLFVLVAGLTMSTLAGNAAHAQPIFLPDTQSYYELIDTGVTWEDARNAAEQLTFLGRQGRLVTITSQTENDFLRDNFSQIAGWIGGFHPIGDPTFQWITGEPFVYTNWAPGEPNGGDSEPVLAIYDDGTWNDFSGTGLGPYFVEYQVPEPTSFALIGAGTLLALARRWQRIDSRAKFPQRTHRF